MVRICGTYERVVSARVNMCRASGEEFINGVKDYMNVLSVTSHAS